MSDLGEVSDSDGGSELEEFNDGNLSINEMLQISVRIFDKKFGNSGFLKLFSEKKYLELIDQDQVNILQKIFEEKVFLVLCQSYTKTKKMC